MLRGFLIAIVVLLGAVRANAECTRFACDCWDVGGTTSVEVEVSRVDGSGRVFATIRAVHGAKADAGGPQVGDEIEIFALDTALPGPVGGTRLLAFPSGDMPATSFTITNDTVMCHDGAHSVSAIAEAQAASSCEAALADAGVAPHECNDTGCRCGSAAFSGALALVPLVLRRRKKQ